MAKQKKMGPLAEAAVFIGLGNVIPGDIEGPFLNDDIDEESVNDDEIPEEDEVLEEFDEDELDDDSDSDESVDPVTRAVEEVKANVAEDVQEIQEADDDNDDEANDETGADADDTTDDATDDTHPAAESQQEEEGSDPMDNNTNTGAVAGVSWAFINSAPEKIFKALTEHQLDPELGKVSLALISAYAKSFDATELIAALKAILEQRSDIIYDVVDWSDAFIDANTIPEYGIRYEGIAGNLDGKTFESEKAACKAAEQALSCGMKFEDLFTFDFFYKNEKGELTERVPEGSKHRELILEKEQLASSQQQSSTAAS